MNTRVFTGYIKNTKNRLIWLNVSTMHVRMEYVLQTPEIPASVIRIPEILVKMGIIMEDNLQNLSVNRKMEVPEKGAIKICNTKTESVSFRLKVENRPKLNTIIDYFKVNDQSKALNLIIEQFDDMKGDQMRSIQEIHEIMAKKRIRIEDL